MPTADGTLPTADILHVSSEGAASTPAESQAPVILSTPGSLLETDAPVEAHQADSSLLSQDGHEPIKSSSEAALDMFEDRDRELQEAAETPTTLDQFRGQYKTVQPVVYAASKNYVLGYVENTYSS
jgi:hypothetical protein